MNFQDLIKKDTVKITQDLDANTITINAGDSKQKLSEIITDFPDNCYVDKQITGCGGTTLVLRNNIDYVILVPYINLLVSKQVDNVGIVELVTKYGDGDSDETIENYLTDKTRPRKILCTFDSLKSLLGIKGFNPQEFKLLVDEAHTLINLGGFKPAICESVLQNYKKFKSAVFLTATPTKRDYFPSALVHLPLCTIVWNNVKAVKFNLQSLEKRVGVNNALFGLCMDYLMGNIEGNAHIFYNSVSEISKTIEKLKKLKDPETKEELFNPNNIRFVCSDNHENKKKVRKTTGERWGEINSITDPVRKINFYTATAFEGADILDEDGQTYIVIDDARDATKVDFHILVPQICGRIRNTRFNEHIHLLVGNIPEAASMTKAEWTSKVKDRIEHSQKRLNALQNPDADPILVADGLVAAGHDKYTFRDDMTGQLYVSDVALKAELQAYEALEATYVVREIEGAEVNTEGYSASFKELLTDEAKQIPFAHKPTGINKLLNGSTQCFSETMKEYCEARDENDTFKIKLVDGYDDIYKTLYDELGHEKIKALDYRKPYIQRAYEAVTAKDDNITVLKALLNLKKDQIVTKAELKPMLQTVYDKLEIKEKAKATDIQNWYKVSETKVNGKNAYKILKI